jgi:hypothetical protein
MSFLDKFTKGVGKAAEQAKFEADKLVRMNRLGSELSQLTTDADKATAAIGTKVMELRAAGGLQMPELDEMIQRVEALKAQVAAKQADLDRARAEKFGEVPPVAQPAVAQPAAPPAEAAYAPPPAPVATEAAPVPPATEAAPAPQATAPAAEPAPSLKFCPSCGATAEPGTKFCSSCGQKLG